MCVWGGVEGWGGGSGIHCINVPKRKEILIEFTYLFIYLLRILIWDFHLMSYPLTNKGPIKHICIYYITISCLQQNIYSDPKAIL
jgi:hypothetical protein